MNLAEVVVREVQCDAMSVHFDLLAEGIGQPGEAAHVLDLLIGVLLRAKSKEQALESMLASAGTPYLKIE